ncbi:MAG: glycosyltransferase [Deltaproteobacteria bacterium]|nr:glycosyltransferase [Deltaproteobacteria bacterium]MBW2360566.1 glycosyltransferase [Deltaproteobacteria bacterium]
MSPGLQTVDLPPLSLESFAPLVGATALQELHGRAEAVRRLLRGRVCWNINSTAVGGGVVEMLQPLLRYTRGAGIDTRWAVIQGSPEFFRITKRLHHALHGSKGDGSELDAAARRSYEGTLEANARELCRVVQPRDIVILHDPQTAGLAAALLQIGARVIWRCHIGCDDRNDETERGWRFLAPFLANVDCCVFSRAAYVPSSLATWPHRVIQPSIDPFSAKNRELEEAVIHTLLVQSGIVEGPPPDPARADFLRADGSAGRLEHQADVVRMGRAPAWDTPLVVQVSRWDPLKDPSGVMRGFAQLVNGHAPSNAELVLAGPNVSAVRDDPEGAETWESTIRAWRALPHTVRNRIHLVCLPMADIEENAILVNALQRHARVVVQKSLREGFGLTVSEAMWKARPVLASRVGGIQDQIEDGKNGVLLRDPKDPDEFAGRLRVLLGDSATRTRLGAAARERVAERFLSIRHLNEYSRLVTEIDAVAEHAR